MGSSILSNIVKVTPEIFVPDAFTWSLSCPIRQIFHLHKQRLDLNQRLNLQIFFKSSPTSKVGVVKLKRPYRLHLNFQDHDSTNLEGTNLFILALENASCAFMTFSSLPSHAFSADC
ncbi:MAG: hypothetical protein CM15mP22_4960 [Gammaproteobacteria bacterium]|nr:MAG: hypothetical protein CM15mP22_4960 [Gammaproteobacteria bacterium]